MKTTPKVPKQLQKLHQVASACVIKLMRSGMSQTKAEDCVLEVLEEQETNIAIGRVDEVIACLKMVFLDMPVENVAKSLFNNLIK